MRYTNDCYKIRSALCARYVSIAFNNLWTLSVRKYPSSQFKTSFVRVGERVFTRQ